MIPSTEDLRKLDELRRRTFEQIRKCLAEDGHCKSYEGTFSIVFPCYFDDEAEWTVSLDMYVFGPSRHYAWTAKTLGEAIDKAAADVISWIAEWEADA